MPSRQDKIELMQLIEEKERRRKERKFYSLYPEDGVLKRALYTKHTEFFAAGAECLARGAIAGNRTGKTTMNAFETTCHLTGIYPVWWVGRFFNRPVDWWAASDTSESTRDILQFEFLGRLDELGTGMIPKENIISFTRKRGVAEAVDTVLVRHKSGGISTLAFKSYDQGREKFQGTKKDGISLDEEPPLPIYTECLTRLTATVPGESNGIMICTFTPLSGMSTVVLMFLNEPNANRFVLTMGFDHVPHLSEKNKKALLDSFPAHERDARANGTPQLGSGAIYPYPESDVFVDDFELPVHWPRAAAMDVGWNKTAGLWLALDRETDTIYFYSEYYRGQAEPPIHAEGFKAKGAWVPVSIDPASRGRSQHDGQQLFQKYKELGLDLEVADNAVETGIYEVQTRFATGRAKIFKSLTNTREEYRLYRRDDKGRIVKEKDHLMDTLRYGVMSAIKRVKVKPVEANNLLDILNNTSGGWG